MFILGVLGRWFEKRTSFERDVVLYYIGKLSAGLIGFMFVPIFSRYLGSEDYAKFSIVIIFSNWAPMALGGWLQQCILRYYSKYASENSNYLSNIFNIQIYISLSLAIVTIFAGYALKLDSMEIFLFVIIVVFTFIRSNLSAIGQAELKPLAVSLSEVARLGIPPAIVLFGYIWQIDKVLLSLLCVSIGLIAASAIMIDIDKLRHVKLFKIDKSITLVMAKYGWPISLWFAFSMGQNAIGRIILQHYSNSVLVGYYSAVQDILSKMATFIIIPIVYALHSRMVILWQERDYKSANRLFNMSLGAALIFSMIFVLSSAFLYVYIQKLINIFPGENYCNYVFNSLVAGGLCLGNMGLLSHKGFEMKENTKAMTIIMALSLVVNIAVSILLVKDYEAYGVAVGMFIGNLIYFILTLVVSKKYYLGPMSGEFVHSNSNIM